MILLELFGYVRAIRVIRFTEAMLRTLLTEVPLC